MLTEVALTGEFKTSKILLKYLTQDDDAPTIHGIDVVQAVRRDLAQYVPRTSRYHQSLRRPIADVWRGPD
jgi:hypothetical protein